MVVGVNREIELLRLASARLVQRPVHQLLGDARAMMLLYEIELLKLDCPRLGRDRELQRTELRITDRLCRLGEAKCKARVCKLGLPSGHCEIRKEGAEVLVRIEMRKGVAEAAAEDPVDRGGVAQHSVAEGHSNPAGAGHVAEWTASTLNSSPISALPVRR